MAAVLAYEARAASAARARYDALSLLVVAVPEVVRQEVQLSLDRVRVGAFDVAADPAVEHRPHAERQALVGDLLGRDMLEEVGLIGLAIEVDEVGGTQGVELLDDGVEVAELRVRAGQHRRLEHAPDDAGDLERPARLLADRIDPRQHEAVQALRQLQRADGGRVARVNTVRRDVADELLDVERVAARSIGDQRHQGLAGLRPRRADLAAGRPDLVELGADELGRIVGVELVEADLRERRQALDAEAAAGLAGRAIGQDDQDRQSERGPAEPLEQVA